MKMRDVIKLLLPVIITLLMIYILIFIHYETKTKHRLKNRLKVNRHPHHLSSRKPEEVDSRNLLKDATRVASDNAFGPTLKEGSNHSVASEVSEAEPLATNDNKVGDDAIRNILLWPMPIDKNTDDITDFSKLGCAVANCRSTHNSKLVEAEKWDAVIWNIQRESHFKTFTLARSARTYHVFQSLRPPVSVGLAKMIPFNNFFNLTMTYRLDSDFPTPFLESIKKSEESITDLNLNYASGKTKMVAVYSKKCMSPSGANVLIKTLQKYLNVEIFGSCGSKGETGKPNTSTLTTFKFYLAFESNLCVDYISNKLLRAYKTGTIPVVYGLGYEAKNLPPHSYINVFDFASVKSLANYMLYLDKNDTAYNEYFAWNSRYLIEKGNSEDRALCDLCEFLNLASTFQKNSTSEDIKKKVIPQIPSIGKGVKMPKAKDVTQYTHVTGVTVVNRHLSRWFHRLCVYPDKDKALMNFISGAT